MSAICVISWGLILATVSGASSDVRISEVMANPVGSEFRNEYVELVNEGDRAVDLLGWTIGDGSTDDRLVPDDRSVLEPGAYALIYDPDYFEGERPYGSLPDVLLFTVADRSFGSAGLANADPESVLLLDAAGDTVDVVRYEIGEDGRSYERIAGRGDGSGVWALSLWRGGTPGRRNSVSRQPRDLAISFGSPPDTILRANEDVEVSLLVTNVGTDGSEETIIVVEGAGTTDSVAVPVLAPSESHEVPFTRSGLAGQRTIFFASLAGGDDNPTNDRLSWSVVFGAGVGSVLINEVMADPVANGEWVEVLNPSGAPVELAGWSLVDASGRAGAVPNVVIDPGGFLVLSEQSGTGRFPVSPWPSLNNGGDTILLKDATGNVVDEMSYAAAPAGRSLERIDADAATGDPANWLENALDPGGTPGRPNRAVRIAVAVDTIDLNQDRNSGVLTIRAAFDAPRSRVTMRIHDRRGRLRRALLQGVEVGSVVEVRWDGTDEGGKPVRPGIYILTLERSGPDDRIIRSRKTINYTKGL